MVSSMLIVYEPIERFERKRDYWNKYINFFEQYWGGPTSPYGVWFGKEYEDFRRSLSKYLGIVEEEIDDCFFMRDDEGRYYISLINPLTNTFALCSENFIPPHWFILFENQERKFFYTHMGFGRIHYCTKINFALARIKDQDEIINRANERYNTTELKSPFFLKLRKIQSEALELYAWLSEFDTSGYLILDYGEICSYIDPLIMKNEHSVKDMWDLLGHIKRDQMEEAQIRLTAMLEKWEDLKRKISSGSYSNTIQ